MRALSLMALVGLGLSGCNDFDCEQRCRELEDDIRAQVTNPGDDPCAREAITTAATCDECEQAFVNEFGLSPEPGFCE